LETRSSSFELKNELFAQQGFDGHGFYDWLRNSKNEVVGLRYDLFEDYFALREELLHHPSCSWQPCKNDSGAILIFFGVSKEVDESVSADQSISGDYLYRSTAGLLALSFELWGTGDFLLLEPGQ